jgi:hypothetical protein
VSDDHREIEDSRGNAQRGLRRLMLKLPSKRPQLQALAVSSLVIRDLFEAYDEACIALECFRLANSSLVEEYEALCAELEADIMRDIDR